MRAVLAGLPVTFVGVRCPLEVVVARRQSEPRERVGEYQPITKTDAIPPSILSWQNEVHVPGDYDLEVDTSVLSSGACAAEILRHVGELTQAPTAFERIAASGTKAATAR